MGVGWNGRSGDGAHLDGTVETGQFPGLFLDATSPCLFNNFPLEVTFAVKAPAEVNKLLGTSLSQTGSHSSEIRHSTHHTIRIGFVDHIYTRVLCLQLVPARPTEAVTLRAPGV